MYDSAGNEIDRVDNTNFGSSPYQTLVGQNGKLLFSILDINTGSSTYSQEVGGYIIICNNGANWMYMGLGPNGWDNPWPHIRRRYNANTGQQKQVGFVPLPKFLQYSVRDGEYGWFMWRPDRAANEFGGGCNQLGIEMKFFNDQFHADQICQGPRYMCVPGFLHTNGPDFTLQDRMTDLYKKTTVERELVDRIVPKTPGQISTYFQEWEVVTTRKQFIDLYQRYQFLPPGWLDVEGENENDPDNVGNYWLHGPMLMFKSRAFNADRIYASFELVVKGELLDVTTTVAVGQFVRDDISNRCAVQRNSIAGSALLTIENTSAEGVGDYIVLTTCNNNIEVRSEPVIELNPRTRGTVMVLLAQSGVVFNESSCTFVLTHPTYRTVVFDRISDYKCEVVEAIGGDPFRNFTRDATCLNWGAACDLQAYGADVAETTEGFTIAAFLFYVLVSLAAFVLAYYLMQSSENIENDRLAYNKKRRNGVLPVNS